MFLKRLAVDLETDPVLTAVRASQDFWRHLTWRQTFPGTCHADTETIFLRLCRELTPEALWCDLNAVDYPALNALPSARALLAQISACVPGVMGRAMLVNLKAGGRVGEHTDEGPYAVHYERFHVPLLSLPGNRFHAGTDSAWMQPGELWWFDKHAPHRVENNSPADRIHLIVDVRPA